jgi:K+-transporting ATPase KdpC subunit
MKNLITAILLTIVTTIMFGLIYPLVVTGLAQVIFPDKANGQLIKGADGNVIGSRIIGQPFAGPGYFRPRPSAAGAAGYDAGASSGSNPSPSIWLPPRAPGLIRIFLRQVPSFRYFGLRESGESPRSRCVRL